MLCSRLGMGAVYDGQALPCAALPFDVNKATLLCSPRTPSENPAPQYPGFGFCLAAMQVLLLLWCVASRHEVSSFRLFWLLLDHWLLAVFRVRAMNSTATMNGSFTSVRKRREALHQCVASCSAGSFC